MPIVQRRRAAPRSRLAARLLGALVLALAHVEPAAAFELGIQDDRVLLRDDGVGRERGLDLARAIGARTVRVNVVWGELRAYGWEPYDALVDAAAARGMTVQMTLMGTPYFLRHLDMRLSYRQPHAPRLADFARTVASRYAGRVRRFSIWNEPNHSQFLQPRGEPARAYRVLYERAYRAIKAVSKHNEVLIGELAPSGNVVGWIAGLTRGKRGLHADGIAVHPYQPAAFAPGEPYPGGVVSFSISNVAYLRLVTRSLRREKRLATPRGRTVPIYMTEFGYQTERPAGARYSEAAAPDAERGRLLRAAIAHARRSGVRQLVLYQLQRTPSGSSDPWDTGLVDEYGRPTAAYEALRAPS